VIAIGERVRVGAPVPEFLQSKKTVPATPDAGADTVLALDAKIGILPSRAQILIQPLFNFSSYEA